VLKCRLRALSNPLRIYCVLYFIASKSSFLTITLVLCSSLMAFKLSRVPYIQHNVCSRRCGIVPLIGILRDTKQCLVYIRVFDYIIVNDSIVRIIFYNCKFSRAHRASKFSKRRINRNILSYNSKLFCL